MPITTSDNDIKERLSIAFATAVAARAGCMLVEWPKDKQSLDVTLRPISGSSEIVDLQLKATSQDVVSEAGVGVELPIKNYNDLRSEDAAAPRYLVALVLPDDATLWLAQDAEQLLLKRCAYWLDLRGMPPTINRKTISVTIPTSNIFDVQSLLGMFEIAEGMRRQRPESRDE